MALRAPNGAALRAGELQGALERGHGWEGPAAEGLAAALVACGSLAEAAALAEHLAGDDGALRRTLEGFLAGERSGAAAGTVARGGPKGGGGRKGRTKKKKGAEGEKPKAKAKARDRTGTSLADGERLKCECQATRHALVANCLACGRIVCQQEGPGPCLFCGVLVTEDLEQRLEALGEARGARLDAAEVSKATEFKDTLVSYDRGGRKKTQVIDDQSDFFEIDSNAWLDEGEKEQLRQTQAAAEAAAEEKRRKLVVTIDLIGRQVLSPANPPEEEVDGPAAGSAPPASMWGAGAALARAEALLVESPADEGPNLAPAGAAMTVNPAAVTRGPPPVFRAPKAKKVAG